MKKLRRIGIIGLILVFMSSLVWAGVNDFITGTVEGTGSLITVEVGFQPRAVDLYNIDGNVILHWVDSMGAGYGQKIVEGATYSNVSTITSGGVTKYAGSAGPILLTATGSVVAGSVIVTGTGGTAFTNELAVRDMINVAGQIRKIINIASASQLTVEFAFDSTASGRPYLMRGRTEGFTIGTDSDVNVSAETVTYRVYR